jgi:superfamily II DNA or RNA helicase
MTPYISKRAYIPRHMVKPSIRTTLSDDLTYTQYQQDTVKGADHRRSIYGYSEAEEQTIKNLLLSHNKKMLSLPRGYAVERFGKSFFSDKTCFPAHSITYPKDIQPRDAKQQQFFDTIYQQAKETGPVSILANATTGSGKSVASIKLGMLLKTPTLIIVDSNKLAAGFIKNFDKFFGRKWRTKYVGRIQQDQCEYKDKAFCIALVQSLRSRKYPSDMYKSFGCIIYDEVQIYGSSYHNVLGMFPARVQVGMTATNKQGSFGKLVEGYLGKPSVISKQEVLVPKAYIVRNRLSHLYNVYSDGTLVNSIAADKQRNELLSRIVLQRGYKRKRVCLVLSDRVAQLQTLKRILSANGVLEDDIGLHVGEYKEDSYTVAYSYDEQRWIRMDLRGVKKTMVKFMVDLACGNHQDHPLVPATVKKAIAKKTPIFFDVVKRIYKPSEQELDYIANSCYIILATYKIFAKGVDYPRIDMGVEATPIGNATQPLGRVLRLPDGFEKPQPEWYAVHDRFIMPPKKGFASDWEADNAVAQTMNHFFDKKASAREKALLKAKAEISYQSGASYKE